MDEGFSSRSSFKSEIQSLVEQYLADSTSPERRNDIAQKLRDEVTIIAIRVCYKLGLSSKTRESLAEDAASHVMLQLEKGMYRPKSGPFAGWCYQVCRNYVRDQVMRRERQMLQLSTAGSSGQHDNGSELCLAELAVDTRAVVDVTIFDTPFSEQDLNTVRSWEHLRDRLIMLAATGLWLKVPEEEWRSWVEEVGWDWPFPPESFLDLEPSERMRELAKLTGIRRNTLSQIWRRRCDWLKQLRCIQELKGDIDHEGM